MKSKVLYKFTVYLCMLYSSIFLLAHKSLAQDDFMTEYNITYTIDINGLAQVSHGVAITNLKNDVIATSYTLGLKQLDIYDITAADKTGKLEIVQNAIGDQNNLDIKLKNFVIGQGRQNSFTIFYKSKSIATKSGEVWNINIPRAQAATATASYNITLVVPKDFGPRIFISPTPSTQKEDSTTITYSFANEVMQNRNIAASFGKFQELNYRIRYQLFNPNWFTSNYELALPPTITNAQEVAYTNLDPQPSNTYLDKDGNYMAVYRLRPKQNLDVELTGSAKLTSMQIDPTQGGKLNQVPPLLAYEYTRKQPFWETDAPKIKDLAKSLFDNKLTVAENARKIYDYLVTNYMYDFSISKKDFVDRLGAASAINRKTDWGCMEFTDTFIAIARSMSIPAREINGYALTTAENTRPISVTLKSGDLLHAWPEFYDPNLGWTQIDPTWGNTSNIDYFSKLDTNHFAFVVKGLNSEYPLPAGTYRISANDKLVEVDFSQIPQPQVFTATFTIKKLFNWNLVALLMGKVRYSVTNTSKVAIFGANKSPILPGKNAVYYIPRTEKSVLFKDAFNDEYTQPLPN